MSAIKSVIATAVLAALLPAVNGEGFTIQNQCGFPVYYKVTTERDSAITAVGPGSSATMPYTSKAGGGGPSVKVSQDPNVVGEILQMEYTLSPGTLYYDISNINGLPFGQHNVKLSTNKQCPEVVCTAGETCTQAYNVPDDDHATKSCPLGGLDTVLTLCSDSTSSGGLLGALPSVISNIVALPAPTQQPANNNFAIPAPAAPAPTTLSTSIVVATPTKTPTPPPAQDNSNPMAVIVSSLNGGVAMENSSSGSSGNTENYLKLDADGNVGHFKRASRIHRHHAHLTSE